MKSILTFATFFFLAGIIVHVSCQKELSCYDCKENQPPIANAGKDTAIILPVDSIMLDGTASIDPDLDTQTSSYSCLFQPNAAFSTVIQNNKIIFFTSVGIEKNKFDIYDIATNSWSIGLLNQNIERASIISYNNVIYIAGAELNGNVSNQVWKLEF